MFSNANNDESLVDFPVLVHLTAANFDFSEAQSAGQDVRFVDGDNLSTLSYEIEDWSATEQLANIWVKIPQIDASSNNDFIYMYWGNSAAPDKQNGAGTWNKGYVAVYHMNDAKDPLKVTDSTGNGNNGTKSGPGTPQQVDAKVGKGQGFDGTDSYIDCGNGPTLSFGNGAFTIEALVDQSPGIAAKAVLSKAERYYAQGYNLWISNSGDNVGTVEGNGASTYANVEQGSLLGSWHSIGIEKSSQLLKIVDGVLTSPGTDLGDLGSVDSTRPLYLGRVSDDAGLSRFQGTIDEVRLSNVARSAKWIKASYLTEIDAFLSFAESMDRDGPFTVSSEAASRILTNSAILNGRLPSLGENGSVRVYFKYGTDPNTLDSATTPQVLSSPGGFSQSIAGLAVNTAYYFQAVAEGPTAVGAATLSFRTPVIDSDYYQAFLNGDGTLRFVNSKNGLVILDNSPASHLDYGSVATPNRPAADPKSQVTTSGDTVVVTSSDDSNAGATISNKYELNIHSPNIKYTVTISYKRDVTVAQERLSFVVPTKAASVMTRDLRLNAFDTTKEYYSDLYTPKVVKFDNGLSFLGNDSMQSMSLRSHDATSSEVSFYADYSLNHPHEYFIKDGNLATVDLSAQNGLAGQSHSAYVTFSIDPGTVLRSLVKTRQPNGYDAVSVFTNHPDDETVPTLNAVAYGTEDTSSPVYGTKGIMGRGFGWTKGVFVSGLPGADLDDPTFKALTDKMYKAGAEIVGHSITPVTDSRAVVSDGLKTLSQYGAKDWIDHGVSYLNYEDLASQGARKGDENYILDIMDANDYYLAWAYVDIPLVLDKPNILHPVFTDWVTPFFFYNSNVDDNTADNKKIYLWSTISTVRVADLVFTPANIDDLISERGVSVAHDYVAYPLDENHTWYTNPSTHKKEILPAFDNELAYMQSKREAGLLWTPTMRAFADYLLLLSGVSIATNANGTYVVTNSNTVSISGLTLLAEADVASVTVDGRTLTTFGGSIGSKEIVIPSIEAGRSVTVAVSYSTAPGTGR